MTANRIALCVATAAALGACGSLPSLPSLSFSRPAIEAGKSTQKDVEAAFGKPTEIIDGAAAGEKILFYNHAPAGGETHAVTLRSDGVVRAFEQRLTRANVQRISCGQSSSRSVRNLLGPPLRVTPRPALGLEEWSYRLSTVSTDPVLLHIAFSRDGIARELFAAIDAAANSSSGNLDLLPSGNVTCLRPGTA
jgi:hypothetical protein